MCVVVWVFTVDTINSLISLGFSLHWKGKRHYSFNNRLILLSLFNHIDYITGYKCITYVMPVCVALTNRVSSTRSRPLNFTALFMSPRPEIPLIQVSLSSNPTLKVKLKRLQFINNKIFTGKASEKRKKQQDGEAKHQPAQYLCSGPSCRCSFTEQTSFYYYSRCSWTIQGPWACNCLANTSKCPARNKELFRFGLFPTNYKGNPTLFTG